MYYATFGAKYAHSPHPVFGHFPWITVAYVPIAARTKEEAWDLAIRHYADVDNVSRIRPGLYRCPVGSLWEFLQTSAKYEAELKSARQALHNPDPLYRFDEVVV